MAAKPTILWQQLAYSFQLLTCLPACCIYLALPATNSANKELTQGSLYGALFFEFHVNYDFFISCLLCPLLIPIELQRLSICCSTAKSRPQLAPCIFLSGWST